MISEYGSARSIFIITQLLFNNSLLISCLHAVMGVRKVFFIILSIFILYLGYKISVLLEPRPLPTLENEWWGPGKPKIPKSDVRPFVINISDEVGDK